MQYDPSPRQMISIVANNVKMFGLRRTVTDVIGYLFTAPPADSFDRTYGVKTAGAVAKWEAGVADGATLEDAVRYVPIPEAVMASIFAKLPSVIDPAQCTFVDLGCGKGRGVIMATWQPFQEVLGVELSPRHAALADQNLTSYLANPRGPRSPRCRNARVECGNALEFTPPDRDLVVFMFRPFKGDVFTGVLDRLHAFHTRTRHRVVIAYACPLEERLLARHPGFTHRHENQVIVEEMSWNLWEARR